LYKAEIQLRKKRLKARVILLLAALFFVGFLYIFFGGHGNGYFKQPLNKALNSDHTFYHLIIERNGIENKLVSGQTIYTHPYDSLKIIKTDTSILFNRGIRLFSKGFDVNSLHEETVIAKLLPYQNIFHHYTYAIKIKHKNETIGEVVLDISPSKEDWLEKLNIITNPKKKLNFLNLAVQEAGDNIDLKAKLADEYLALKKWKEGANIIEDILIEKKDLDLMERLAGIYKNMHQYNMLIATLRKILVKSPGSVRLRAQLAEILEEQGRIKEAVKEYALVCEKLEVDDKIACMKNVGYLLFKNDRKKEALNWYIKAAELDKSDPNLYYNIGSIYDDLKNPKLAEKYLRLAVALKKDDTGGRLRLGQSLLKKGKLKDAKGYVKEILKKDPKNLEALLLLTNIEEKEGDSEALKRTYGKILSLDPKNTTVLFNLAVLEAEKGDIKKGTSYFKKLIKINPKDIQAREALFTLYQRRKQDDLAFNQAVMLIKLAPKKISHYTYIFNYLVAQSKFDKLAKYMRKGVKANPKNFELRQYLILSYLNQEKRELATKELKAALKLRPNDITLLYQLGKIEEDADNFDQALALYNKILTLSPGDEKAEEIYLNLKLRLLKKKK
jgi:tetratricopeptide (TPR) repeat protein